MHAYDQSSTVIGIGSGFGILIFGFLLEGGNPKALVGISALIIILGGTFGALTASFNLKTVLSIPKLFSLSMLAPEGPDADIVLEIISFAEKARREGLLSLEDEVDKLDNPFMQKGVRMMVDGVDPEAIRSILEKEIELFEENRKHEASVFEAAGGFSPTMGIIGTVMGLVLVLANLGGNAAELGHSIATAFIATLYGIGFANVVWLPVGLKLKLKLKEEVKRMELIMIGILAIQAGDNPTLIKERLVSYLDEDDAKTLYNAKGEGE